MANIWKNVLFVYNFFAFHCLLERSLLRRHREKIKQQFKIERRACPTLLLPDHLQAPTHLQGLHLHLQANLGHDNGDEGKRCSARGRPARRVESPPRSGDDGPGQRQDQALYPPSIHHGRRRRRTTTATPAAGGVAGEAAAEEKATAARSREWVQS